MTLALPQTAFSFAAADKPQDTITAHGETLHVWQWAKRLGLSEDTLKKRIKAGWLPEKAVSAPKENTNRPIVRGLQIPKGEPGSYTWSHLPYDRDPWAQSFVDAHPDGATMDEVGAAMGVEVSWVCEVEKTAIAKLTAKLKEVAAGKLSSLEGQMGLVSVGRGDAVEIDMAALLLVDALLERMDGDGDE